MSALASILIGAAVRVGASTVKFILEKQVGGVAGEIGGTVSTISLLAGSNDSRHDERFNNVSCPVPVLLYIVPVDHLSSLPCWTGS